MKIIGFGHRSRSGKDTAADFIVDSLNEWSAVVESSLNAGIVPFPGQPWFVKLSFASLLKETCREFFPLLESEQYYNDHPEYRTVLIQPYGMTPVQIWVHVGTALREVNPKIWIELLDRKLKKMPDVDVVVIPDVRQHNEVEYIKSMGGVCVKINRDIEKQSGASIDDVLEDFDGWDYVINNDDTLDSFLTKIEALKLKVIYG